VILQPKLFKSSFYQVFMSFESEKITCLGKEDKSKKGEIDFKVRSLVSLINQRKDYYTTSSCSGRVYFWTGSGKKNETVWLKVSHDLIDESFLTLDDVQGLVWLRLEGFITHVACRNMEAADTFLQLAKKQYKKSSLLSFRKKIIVEIRGSEFVEMPFFENGMKLLEPEFPILRILNEKLDKIFSGIQKFENLIKDL
jgi:tRNA wybutosine-synthesizing protein 3